MGAVARRVVKPRAALSENADASDVARRVRDLEKEQAPFATGRELEYVVTGAGNVTRRHGLGRAVRGWFVTERTTAASIYHIAPLNDTVNITFNFSGAITARIWIY